MHSAIAALARALRTSTTGITLEHKIDAFQQLRILKRLGRDAAHLHTDRDGKAKIQVYVPNFRAHLAQYMLLCRPS